jgi:rare lipoprotein A
MMKLASFALIALCLPSLAAAAMPSCPATVLAPLPASVPAPEMRHAAPVASCVELNAVAYVQRLRQPAPAPAAPAAASGTEGYVQKTQFDNTPWRFDMNQNGRRMTAEEFDAWMKAKGIRVATGKPGGAAAAPAPAATAAPAAAPAAAGCQPSATVTC